MIFRGDAIKLRVVSFSIYFSLNASQYRIERTALQEGVAENPTRFRGRLVLTQVSLGKPGAEAPAHGGKHKVEEHSAAQI